MLPSYIFYLIYVNTIWKKFKNYYSKKGVYLRAVLRNKKLLTLAMKL